MTTHVDGDAPPAAHPDEEPPDSRAEWVRAEMQRRMATSRSTRGRHARSAEPPPPADPAPADHLRRRADPAPWITASPAESYVPRHSVPLAPPGTPRSTVGGPSLPPTGVPARRRRANGAAPDETWTPRVPGDEPARRLGAPPPRLDDADPDPEASWGMPLLPAREATDPAAATDETPVPEPEPEPAPADVADPPTAPHPIVLSRRALRVNVPVQRAAERPVTPRPVTPRSVPVVDAEPPEPGSTRVRVVLSERKGVARAVRTIKEVQEGTAVGELLRRDLIRSQLKVTLRFALLTVVVLGALPAAIALLPQAPHVPVLLGLSVPWVVLGVLMYPFLVAVAWRYTRVADRVEQDFADHIQD